MKPRHAGTSPRATGGRRSSTVSGRVCPNCNRSLRACVCRRARADERAPVGDGIVRVLRETKGRKGKGVTRIEGVPLPPAELAELAAKLKRGCGSGGTVKGRVIEIQGDHRDRLVAELEALGWKVKRAGG